MLLKDIIFTNKFLDLDLDMPVPASSMLPDWYKKTENYVTDAKVPIEGKPSGTIKKCIPVFDSISAGYFILLPTDLYCESNGDGNFTFQWPSFDIIEFHGIDQAKLYPMKNKEVGAVAKFVNPWGIKTPKGYSILVTTPQHRDLPFTILPGIIDTDKYINPINFPFIINDKNFNGIIPKGTPIAQIIPFKRDSWKMSIGNKKDGKQLLNMNNRLSLEFFDKYKRLWWNKKVYK
jgi:hypothetical protein